VAQCLAVGMDGAGHAWNILRHGQFMGGDGVAHVDRGGTYASKGPFWALASEWLGATTAAAGLAQINALGNLSGFFFNYLIGWIKDEKAVFRWALMPIAAVAAVRTLCVLTLGRNQPRTTPVHA